MYTLNHNLADALCSIIACGFLAQMADRYKPGSSSDNFTDFIWEDGEKDKYKRLEGVLKEIQIKVEFRTPPSKESTPFIMAKTRKLTHEVQMGLQKDMRNWSNTLEDSINKTDGGKLRGAYLGGYNDISKTEVLGVSDLYQYAAKFRAADVNDCVSELEASYEGARRVTNAVIDHLERKTVPCVRRIREELHPVTEPYLPQHLFASVHGMTRSIITYPPSIDSQAVHFELALGSATNKVASCIPCSLLMSAIGQPATATHLGRGDNWNFPLKSNEYIRGLWAQYVVNCYTKGKDLLQKRDNTPLLAKWFQKYGESTDLKKIPDMFLEALTYESSFMTKLERTLNL